MFIYMVVLARLGTSDSLLHSIQEKIKWADSMSDLDRRHKKEVEDKAEEMRKSIKVRGLVSSRDMAAST